jgi:hypothetical protein
MGLRTSPISDAAWEAFPDRAGECGARGRTCNPRSGGFGHHLSGTMTGARGAIAGLGQVGAGNTRLATIEAASQEAWPEAESLAMKDSLGREPRWNADSRAPPV